MRQQFQATTYLSIAELEQAAASKFEEASQLPDGPERREVLKSALGYRSLAELKGWLSGELRPPN